MSLLKELLPLIEKKVGDEQYFITVPGKGSSIDLYTEKAYSSYAAAERALTKFQTLNDSRDADTDAADEDYAELEDAEIMSGADLKKKHPKLFEDAELAKKLVRGEKGPKGILNKLNHWFGSLIVEKDKNRFLPAPVALKALKSYGFSVDQITAIREAAMEAAQTAVKTMQSKYGGRVPDKYLSKMASSFAVFDLFLNVSEDIHKEYAALMRKLFDAKLDKMKDKLIIVKESADHQLDESADDQLDESAGDQMRRHALTMKREGNLDFYHKQMMKYHEHMQSAEESNLSRHGRLSMSGRAAIKNIAKHKKGYDEHKKALRELEAAPKVTEAFGIKIDGELWMKGDKPVTFASQEEAEAVILKSPSMSEKNSKVVPLNESPELQSLGKGLKTLGAKAPKPVETATGTPPEDEAEAKTAVNTPPAEKAAADDAAAEPASKFKVGDKVTTSVGPHKGQKHSVIHVFPDGRVNLKPDDLTPDQIKYRQGAVTAKPDQITIAEARKSNGTLFASVVALEEGKNSKQLDEGVISSIKSLAQKFGKFLMKPSVNPTDIKAYVEAQMELEDLRDKKWCAELAASLPDKALEVAIEKPQGIRSSILMAIQVEHQKRKSSTK